MFLNIMICYVIHIEMISKLNLVVTIIAPWHIVHSLHHLRTLNDLYCNVVIVVSSKSAYSTSDEGEPTFFNQCFISSIRDDIPCA